MPTPATSLAQYIDHTLLKPDCTEAQIKQLCAEAAEYEFAAVCVPPCWVNVAFTELNNTRVNVATVVGFPLGYTTFPNKVNEAHDVIARGANEVDAVMNISAFKSGQHGYVHKELMALSDVCHAGAAILKVIIETALLSPEEIIEACRLCIEADVAFVKTSTGFSTRGASLDDIRIMRSVLPSTIQVKASGGIKTVGFARQLVNAGATRLGTSSGLELVKGQV